MPHIYSTLSAAVNYQVYDKGPNDLPIPVSEIVIQGGANIPDKYMRTPDGAVATPVTDEQLANLRLNPVFQMHEKNGFIVIKDKPVDGEKVAADMEGRDKSAPLVDQDFEAAGQTAPVTSKADDMPAPTPVKSGRRA